MLPTNEKASFKIGDIGLHPVQGLVINKNPNLDNIIKAIPKSANYTKQHLYILSDEKIEEGDKYLLPNGLITEAVTNYQRPIEYRKVIASTDESLNLSKPSPTFINKYVSEYNKGNIISDIMVEYENRDVNPLSETWREDYIRFGLKHKENIQTLLRVSDDNTITIRKVKDSWDREEVERLCRKAYSDAFSDATDFNPLFSYSENKWIEENL